MKYLWFIFIISQFPFLAIDGQTSEVTPNLGENWSNIWMTDGTEGEAAGFGLGWIWGAVESSDAAYLLALDGELRSTWVLNKANGYIIDRWGRRGAGPGEFESPISIALGEHYVWVHDISLNRLSQFTESGQYLRSVHPDDFSLSAFTILNLSKQDLLMHRPFTRQGGPIIINLHFSEEQSSITTILEASALESQLPSSSTLSSGLLSTSAIVVDEQTIIIAPEYPPVLFRSTGEGASLLEPFLDLQSLVGRCQGPLEYARGSASRCYISGIWHEPNTDRVLVLVVRSAISEGEGGQPRIDPAGATDMLFLIDCSDEQVVDTWTVEVGSWSIIQLLSSGEILLTGTKDATPMLALYRAIAW